MRILIAFLILIHLAAAAWMLVTALSDGAAPLEPGTRTTPAAPTQPSPSIEAEAAPASPFVDGMRVATPVPAVAPAGDLAVEIVVGATGEPAPDARAHYLDEAAVTPEARAAFHTDRTAFVERRGSTFRPDNQGVVRVPRPAQRAWLFARQGDLYGLLRCDGNTARPLRLELIADRPVTIVVRGATGSRFAGAAVSLLLITEGTGYYRQSALGETDGDGRLEVPHFLHRLDALARLYGRLERTVVALDYPGMHGSAVELDLDALPAQDVELVATPTGSLVVRLRGADGEPLAITAHASLEVGLDPHTPAPLWYRGHVAGHGRGEVVFPRVAVGVAGRLTVEFGDTVHGPIEVEGPSHPGQLIELDVPLGATRPILQLRIVDHRGQAVTHSGFHYTLACGGEQTGTLRTNDDGHAQVVLPAGAIGEVAEGFTLHRRLGGDQIAHVAIGFALRPGVNDLGTAVFGTAPRVASGRVTDDTGAGISDARIWVERVASDGSSWIADRSLAVQRSGSQFAVHGVVGASPVRLRAEHPDHMTHHGVLFTPGETEVEIALPRAGSLTVHARLDPGLPLEQIDWSVRQFDRPLVLPRQLRWNGPGSGIVRWPKLAAGTYELTGRAMGRFEPFVSLDSIVVRPGTAADDPRLQPLDLRGLLRPLAVTLLRPDGRPLSTPGAWVFSITADGRLGEGTHAVDGVARLVVRGPSAHIVATAAGYRSEERLRVVSSECTITLRPGLVVEIEIEAADVPGGDTLEVALTDIMPQRRFSVRAPGAVAGPALPAAPGSGQGPCRQIDPQTFATVLAAPGIYGVRAWVRTADGLRTELGGLQPAVVEVTESTGTQRFRIGMDPARGRE